MPNDPVLRLLGLARKAGRLEVGEEPVGAACRSRQARLVLLAADAAPNTRRRAAHFGEAGNVLWLEAPFEKGELGFVLGRSSCAMLALTDAGLAASVAEKLAARDPDKYGPAAAQLRTRADRVLQRQKEQRQHEKNLRQGRRKPWAPPPPGREEAPPQRGRSRPAKAVRSAKVGPGTPVPPSPKADKRGPAGRRLTGKFRKP
ncbi:MAG: 50S ribosomal protein L7 [Lawsonibacter sp.]|nr:50S ribosomal protein L7 [Lawsonibacter sp.]